MKLGELCKLEWHIRKQRGRGSVKPKWIISVWDEDNEWFDTIIEVYTYEALAKAIMAIPAMLTALVGCIGVFEGLMKTIAIDPKNLKAIRSVLTMMGVALKKARD